MSESRFDMNKWIRGGRGEQGGDKAAKTAKGGSGLEPEDAAAAVELIDEMIESLNGVKGFIAASSEAEGSLVEKSREEGQRRR